jgi:hypothetical protein
MKYGLTLAVLLSLAAGVIVGSQARPTLRYPSSIAREYGRDETPAKRLALSLIEVGDALASMAGGEQNLRRSR